MNIKVLKAAVAGLVLSVSGLANAGLIPFGIHTNTSATTVTNTWGWDECFSTSSGSSVSVSDALSGCTGDQLMMATRIAGTDNLLILAAASFSTVTAQTAFLNNQQSTNSENGVDWYSNGYSWGFTDVGNLVRQNSADINLHASYGNNIGMSWHTGGNVASNSNWGQNSSVAMVSLRSGWAFNNGNNFSSVQERVLFSLNSVEVPEPSTLAIFALGIMGLASRRFKKQ